MNQLQEAIQFGERLAELKSMWEEKEASVRTLKEEYRRIEQEILPDILDELGVAQITLANGQTITLSSFPTGRITNDTKEAAFQWLMENNHQAIIKNSYRVDFDPGDPMANSLQAFLVGQAVPFDSKADIHPQTLKAFIKEMHGTPGFPDDLFNIYEVKKVSFSG